MLPERHKPFVESKRVLNNKCIKGSELLSQKLKLTTDLQDIKSKKDIGPEPLLRIDSTRPSGQQLSFTDVSTPWPVPTEQSRAANIRCREHVPYRAKNWECCKRFWSFEPEVTHFRQGIKMSHLLELQGSLEINYLIKHEKKKFHPINKERESSVNNRLRQ